MGHICSKQPTTGSLATANNDRLKPALGLDPAHDTKKIAIGVLDVQLQVY